MSIKEFLKDKLVFLFINIISAILFLLFFIFLRVKPIYIIGIILVWFTPITTFIISEYLKRKSFYENLESTLDSLDKKYLLTEVMEEPDFIDGKILYDILTVTDKNMHEHVKYYKEMQRDYRDYIEAWVHEVKTPIASSKLIIGNNKSPITKSINEELLKVEEFVQQVLYYSRSNDANKDYLVKEFNLNEPIKSIITKNSKDFIHRKIKLNLSEINYEVYSDIKWVEFILNQVLVNAIKYSDKDNSEIKIYANKYENNVVLTIEDNGVGISKQDIKRIFDKGFTGENGRRYGKSTGMGLYICNKLSKKLSLGIDVKSNIGEGTRVDVIFPISKITLLED